MNDDEARFYAALAQAANPFEVVRLIMARLFPKPDVIIEPVPFRPTVDAERLTASIFNEERYANALRAVQMQRDQAQYQNHGFGSGLLNALAQSQLQQKGLSNGAFGSLLGALGGVGPG